MSRPAVVIDVVVRRPVRESHFSGVAPSVSALLLVLVLVIVMATQPCCCCPVGLPSSICTNEKVLAAAECGEA